MRTIIKRKILTNIHNELLKELKEENFILRCVKL